MHSDDLLAKRNRRDCPSAAVEQRDYVIDNFVPFEHMREALRLQSIPKAELVDLILLSPESLQRKREAFLHLGWTDDSKFQELKQALAALRTDLANRNAFIYRKSVWNEQPTLYEQHEQGIAPFNSIEEALEDARFEMATEEWDEDCLLWQVFEKWERDTQGTWCNPYTYYGILDRHARSWGIQCSIVFFEKNEYVPFDHAWRAVNGDRFNGPDCLRRAAQVAFAPGDIVTLDCRPFASRAHALILRSGTSGISDGPYALVRLYGRAEEAGRERWSSLSIANGGGLSIELPGYSPFYRLAKWDGAALPSREDILRDVDEWIGGDAYRAAKLDAEVLAADEGMNDRDLYAFIEKES